MCLFDIFYKVVLNCGQFINKHKKGEKMIIRSIISWFGSLILVRHKAVRCGHRTQKKGLVSAFGLTIMTDMPKNPDGSVDYCLDCISKMAIRCAWCGSPIFIGDPITLYLANSRFGFLSNRSLEEAQKEPGYKEFVSSDGVAVYFDNKFFLVGCLRRNCADSGADRAGFWLPGEDGHGCACRIPTPYDLILDAKEPVAVIIDDLSDQGEAAKPTVVSLKNPSEK